MSVSIDNFHWVIIVCNKVDLEIHVSCRTIVRFDGINGEICVVIRLCILVTTVKGNTFTEVKHSGIVNMIESKSVSTGLRGKEITGKFDSEVCSGDIKSEYRTIVPFPEVTSVRTLRIIEIPRFLWDDNFTISQLAFHSVGNQNVIDVVLST